MIVIMLLVAAMIVIVAAVPGVRRGGDREEISWIDAGLKAAVIFIGVTVLTVLIPSYVMQREEVAELDRTAQDLIGATIWIVALVAVLWLLRSAQRQDRV